MEDSQKSIEELREEVKKLRNELAETQTQLMKAEEILQTMDAIEKKESKIRDQDNSINIANEVVRGNNSENPVNSNITPENRLEKQYFAILEDQTELIARFLPDGTLMFVNRAYCNYFGKTREELIGHTYQPVIFPEDIEKINQMLESLCLEHPVGTIEHRAIVKGELRWMQWTNRAIFDEQGNFIEFQSVGRDVTKRINAEIARRENEELFRTIFEKGPLGMAIMSLDYHWLNVNIMLCEMLGYSKEELTQLTFTEITHPDDLDQDLELINKLYKGEIQHYKLQKRYLMKNKEIKWVMLTGSIVRNQEGNPLYYLKMIEDISAIYKELHLRQQAENILRKYERIVSATTDAISLVNTNYVYEAVNQTYLNWYNKSYEEIMGHFVHEIIGQETFENTVKPYLDQCISGTIVHHEMSRIDEIKGNQFLSVTYAPSIEKDQTISGVVISVRDITEIKQKQQIEASLKEKEVLLKEIHHRVKNNLQVIDSLLNLQSRSIQDTLIREKFKESQNRVKLMALIHQHLYRSDDFSQIDLSKYIHELVNILCTSYKFKSSAIDVKIDIQKKFFLDIDTAVPCGLIINELVSNALKYAFDTEQNNKSVLYIGVTSNEEKNLVLTIADNGKGLSSDLDWEKSPTLGLKLVKNLTNQLRGQMTVKHDLGTEFVIVLTRVKYKD